MKFNINTVVVSFINLFLNMFWIEKIESRKKYCICKVKWLSFRIVNVDIHGLLLSIYIKPENGNDTLICNIRKGEPFPNNLDYDFIFEPFEHAKISVISGSATLVGVVVDAVIENDEKDDYPLNCPFTNLDNEAEWIEDKKKLGN